jgi:hypothetical protein
MAAIETGSVPDGKIKDGKFLDFRQGCRPWWGYLAAGLESTERLRQSFSKVSQPGAPLYKRSRFYITGRFPISREYDMG